MELKSLDEQVSVSKQISADDFELLTANGIEVLVCNRPDHESVNQPTFEHIATIAQQHGIEALHIPFMGNQITDLHREQFIAVLVGGKKVHAYCRTGNRSSQLWAVTRQQQGLETSELIESGKLAGFDVASSLGQDPVAAPVPPSGSVGTLHYDVVIMGAGSAGIAVAASLGKRRRDLRIVLIDPADDHFYQPGWTMVGAGVFNAASTRRHTRDVIPHDVDWLQNAITAFSPSEKNVLLSNGCAVHYDHLVVASGLKLDWSAVEGLEESLGKNGVTSNYRYDLAPYTWELVQQLKGGKAIFTQPPMPIKCAGAPQKALYLSADYWLKSGALKDIDIQFYNAGAVLFGVEDYVPALMTYIKKYQAALNFKQTLVKVDGDKKQAWFKTVDGLGEEVIINTDFNMLHVCPPQCAPDVISNSVLADAAGWLDVNAHSLQHTRHSDIWGLGDVTNTPNAKTMAAARKQAPVVAQNICEVLANRAPSASYDGYGSCPLTVERGKIVLAEFGYSGKLLPSFPNWLNDGTKPTTLAWYLKAKLLPTLYWHGMLKGREWLASPGKQDTGQL